MIFKKPALILVHCICWLIFLSLPVFFVAGHGGKTFLMMADPLGWVCFSLYVFIFYLHTYFLLPKLYFKRRYILYVLSLLLLTISVYFLRPYDSLVNHVTAKQKNGYADRNFTYPGKEHLSCPADKNTFPESYFTAGIKSKPPRPNFDLISFVLFMVVIATGVTIAVTKRWRLAVEKASRAEADKANAELSLLKAQINPHFLFNTLNNIYSMAVIKDGHTAESIMMLSNIMRYVTDDAKETFVSLQNETDFISDYIALQRLRLGTKVELNFNVSGSLADKEIAPMLLITFIENVFKYGTSNNMPSSILIELRTGKDYIHFSCRNKIMLPLKESLESTGIGISNTKKRLEHLYPNRHVLNISKDNSFYAVDLKLTLN